MANEESVAGRQWLRTGSRGAVRFIILLGVVSLFADATYESARSILGPFLASLGATGVTVGLIAGFGELLNNGLRVFFGYFADRTGRYWAITIIGFVINVASVPLLAFAGSPFVAATLVFLERAGKAVRNPPRDAMLSSAAQQVGHGWCFGLQEALGQVGAVVGPLLVAFGMSLGFGYRFFFALLAVPAVLTLAVLLVSRKLYPDPGRFETEPAPPERRPLPRVFWPFLAATGLVAAGYLDFQLIAYYLTRKNVNPSAWVPALYAAAMGMQAVAAFGFGTLYDRCPVAALLISCFVACPVAPLVFLSGFHFVIVAMVLWGVGMGAQKAVFKATISRLIPPGQRGTAYGVFYAGYGIAWFFGSALLGKLLDVSHDGLIAFSVACQLLAGSILLVVCKGLRPGGRSPS